MAAPLVQPPDGHVYYFAIGVMANPESLHSRNLHPVRSYAAEISDFELAFFGPEGFAAARAKPGASFHGVLHLMRPDEKTMLDKIEACYVEAPGCAHVYNCKISENIAAQGEGAGGCGCPLRDGDEVSCSVYIESEEKIKQVDDSTITKPPSQRYIDVISKGCRYFGVAEEHLQWLSNLEVRPRKKDGEFQRLSFKLKDGLEACEEPTQDILSSGGTNFTGTQLPEFAAVEVATRSGAACPAGGDGSSAKDSSSTMLSIYCGLVLEWTGEVTGPLYDLLQPMSGGKDIIFGVTRNIYDPYYGIPASAEAMSAEHRKAMEDFLTFHKATQDNFRICGRIVEE
ncbi:unnamed protein product [Polarella glacialis]|uniref:Uncharacterized protein n=1 Tax=Polarella glacialis TaxID=89957 RepID=A0A813K9F0_POLGL|nr:unnamed protein product [Polarella glacialis]